MEAKILELLEKQLKIQEKINLLIKKENKITQEIESMIKTGSRKNPDLRGKNLLKKKFKDLGFSISSSKSKNIIFLHLSKGIKNINVVLTESTYREGAYNGWYTLKPEVEEVADFLILIYSDSYGTESFVTLENSSLRLILKSIKKMPDGRVNLQLKGDESRALEVQSGYDVSKTINDLNILL